MPQQGELVWSGKQAVSSGAHRPAPLGPGFVSTLIGCACCNSYSALCRTCTQCGTIAGMSDTFDALALLDIAADQWGLLTTAQTRKVGGTPQRIARLAAAGTLERLRHGVYRIAGSPSHPHDQLRGAWLMLDPERTAGERLRDEHPGVVSHRSAADIHRLGNLDADVFDFTVADRRQSRLKDLRFHRAALTMDQWALVDGLPVTILLTTVEQLAAANIDGGHLAGAVRDALTLRHVDLAELAAVLRPHAHRYGAMLGDGYGLVKLLLEQAGVPQSTLDVARLSAAPDVAAMARLISSNPELRRLTDEMARIGPAPVQGLDFSAISGGIASSQLATWSQCSG